MPQEFFYPITGAPHDLPAVENTYNVFGGGNVNSATRPGGGRSGPMTHDDATTYVHKVGQPHQQAYNLDWPGPMAEWAGVLTLGWRQCSLDAVGIQRKLAFLKAGPTYGGTATTAYDASTTWTTQGPIDVSNGATYRPGGGTWVNSDFGETTTFAVTFTDLDVGQLAVTSIWGEVSYTPPGGGFAFLLGLAGLAALPYLGTFADFEQFERYANWRTHHHMRGTVWAPGEIQKAWDDVQAYTYPTFYFQG